MTEILKSKGSRRAFLEQEETAAKDESFNLEQMVQQKNHTHITMILYIYFFLSREMFFKPQRLNKCGYKRTRTQK